jgi:hypothetical protein
MRRRIPRLLFAAVLVAVIAVSGAVVVREVYAPRLTLVLRDLLAGSPAHLAVPLDDSVEIRLHATTRPHIGKIATLQKGLVLVHRGQPVIEEGYGFGLPIIDAPGGAHVSRHAQTAIHRGDGTVELVKSYRIDVVDTPVRPFRRKYRDVDPLGHVVFTYTIRPPDAIDVRADFRGLHAPWERAYLMNEQGARAFTSYLEAGGSVVDASEMGIWQEATAPFGCWNSPERGLSFCVEARSGQPGFVGRERYLQFNWLGFYALSWSGIDIAVDAPRETYEYTIHIVRETPDA